MPIFHSVVYFNFFSCSSVYKKQLYILFYLLDVLDSDISWGYKLQSKFVSSAKVWDPVCYIPSEFKI
jgi:hypothetical protein